jgi:hypothetical protein
VGCNFSGRQRSVIVLEVSEPRMPEAMPLHVLSTPSGGVRGSVEQLELGLQHVNALRGFGPGQPLAECVGLVRLFRQRRAP